MKKEVLVIGAGLGGLSVALRLSSKGYNVTILEKGCSAGGRLNQVKLDGFTFDAGPTFMSMTYELDELFDYCGIKPGIELERLDPLYNVFFERRNEPLVITGNLEKLEEQFRGIEDNLKEKAEKYLDKAGEFFHDTYDKVVKSNFNGILHYLLKLTTVPPKHIPFLVRSMWKNAEKYFDSEEAKIIFTLVAFFLGDTPYRTPAVYSLLSYTEMRHNGYWRVKGGMYALVEELVSHLKSRGVRLVFDTEITDIESEGGKMLSALDADGNKWKADIFISNSDAAAFRGKVLKRKSFGEDKLDKMHWTLAPFTIYLGLDIKLEQLGHHNYFLGDNFEGYADKIFTQSVSPQKPYYYVNVPTKTNPDTAPEGGEAVMILCPVPDLRYKTSWEDREELAENIIDDLADRCGTDFRDNITAKKILDPLDWRNMFNLYRGSGLSLAHDMNQVGAFRPSNKDEKLKNLYYVGASTVPGTGLPMVIISSKLVMERLNKDHGFIL